MAVHPDQALLLIARTPSVSRGGPDDPLNALAWEDLDALFTSFLSDVLRMLTHLSYTDVILYRNPKEISDDFFLQYRQHLILEDLDGRPLSEQLQQGTEKVFENGYRRLVILLENNPLLDPATVKGAFSQLGYEDDCFVVGPTPEGRLYLLGLKSKHSYLFEVAEDDPLDTAHGLLHRVCRVDNFLFPLKARFALDSTAHLLDLRNEIEALPRAAEYFPAKTFEIFKLIDKKYKLRKPQR